MTDRPDQSRTVFSAPAVDPEDIEQEYQLLILQGKTPSRRILYQRALRYEAMIFDFTEDPAGITDMTWSETPTTPVEVYQQLTNWALAQSEVIQNAVLDFLEDPTEKALTDLMADLNLKEEAPKTQELSLTSAILTYCQTPRTLPDLYQLARNLLPNSERPEAAVRQITRRLIKSNKLEKTADVYCSSK